MALGGYKRIALAARAAQKRIRERHKTRHPQEQNFNHAQPASEIGLEQTLSIGLVGSSVPYDASIPQKKAKQQDKEEQRLKKLEKRKRRRERKQQQLKNDQKSIRTTEELAARQGNTTQTSLQGDDCSGIQNLPDRFTEVDDSAKYDLAVKFGWVHLKEGTPGPIRDDFFDSAFEEGHSLRKEEINPITDRLDATKGLNPRTHQSLPNKCPPRTPTCSPPTEDPVTPTRPPRHPDVLTITPSRRHASPQLEFIVSPRSSIPLKAAASLLVNLKSRTARLNEQIASFNTRLLRIQSKYSSPTKPKSVDAMAKEKALGRIIAATEKHSNQIFLLEFALRDMVDEGDENLTASLRKTEIEFVELVKVYERKMQKLLGKLSSEALEKTLKGVGDKSPRNLRI